MTFSTFSWLTQILVAKMNNETNQTKPVFLSSIALFFTNQKVFSKNSPVSIKFTVSMKYFHWKCEEIFSAWDQKKYHLMRLGRAPTVQALFCLGKVEDNQNFLVRDQSISVQMFLLLLFHNTYSKKE